MWKKCQFLLLWSHADANVCAGTTTTANIGSWRISAVAETTGWTWRIIPTQTTALPTATTQTGRRSSEARPAGRAHPTTPAHRWGTAHLSTTHQTTRAHRSRSGAAAKHNRSCPGLLVAAIDSETQQMPYTDCGLHPEAVWSPVYQSVQHGCHLLASAAAHLGNLAGSGLKQAAD